MESAKNPIPLSRDTMGGAGNSLDSGLLKIGEPASKQVNAYNL